jgi:geranylgeranyl pyrophosphate synthase
MQDNNLKQAVDGCIGALLASFAETTDLHQLLLRAVGSVGGDAHGKSWSLLPAIVCEAVCGRYDRAVPAATMVHLLNAAAELFDDVEDADVPDDSLAGSSPATAVNAATALLILSQRAVRQFSLYGVDDATAIQAIEAVNTGYTKACAGQHRDLTVERDSIPDESAYLEITAMKSASTIECACHAGALLGGAGETVIGLFIKYGNLLGMSAQIANDIQGITDGRDILHRRMTLPVIFGLNHTGGQSFNRLQRYFSERDAGEEKTAEIKDILFQSGAIQYTMITMALYRQEAQDALDTLAHNGVTIGTLEKYLK